MSVRHDWYQSDAKVVVTVLLKNAKEKNYKVTIEPQHFNMTADGYELDLRLYAPINVERSSYKDYPSKVEITLAKQEGIRWESLETKTVTAAPALIAPPPIHKKNWDSLAKEVEKKEEEEAQSEEALQRLFKKIYSSSSPEVQKAMNKSFSESGGTVLSTNWNEVSKQQVEVKPPEGTEFKKWDEV
uniref:SGS domain-containing protein n=1 Tax=Glossina pallidipes TaxID=7398 RepID=A0A1B0AB01_GLOPL